METKIKNLVIGAGVGGLGAGCWLKNYAEDFIIIDKSPELPKNLNNGVHYLHDIPLLPFNARVKEITMTDGILEHGEIHSSPTLMHSLKYSAKVREVLHPSSIMEVGKRKEVYMPKSNDINSFLEEMYDYIGEKNFLFGKELTDWSPMAKEAKFLDKNGDEITIQYDNVISTLPLYLVSKFIETKVKLESSSVYITNFKVENIVPNWLINLYVPERYSPIYRASILNGVCSIESMKELDDRDLKNTIDMFFMFDLVKDNVKRFTWKDGKVISISKDDRAEIVERLHQLGIYQCGRFGLWDRKLLMDSTINQTKSIVEFINGGDWNLTKDKLINTK